MFEVPFVIYGDEVFDIETKQRLSRVAEITVSDWKDVMENQILTIGASAAFAEIRPVPFVVEV